MDDGWERELVQDVKQALGVVAKYGTEKSVILLHFEGRKYKGVKLKDWEKKT